MGGVAKSFRSAKGDEQTVLSQVDIDITAGEFVCLVGPIGCGKTTLINLLAGFAGSRRISSAGAVPRTAAPVDTGPSDSTDSCQIPGATRGDA